MRRTLTAAGTALGLTLFWLPSAQAADQTTVGLWNFDEPYGTSVARDDSGNGLDGTVGTEVETGVVFDGATAYRFAYLQPNTPPAHPEHIVTIPDAPQLDPGTSDYAVTVRFRTTRKFGNILQKGQSGAIGGMWKFQAPKGIVHCLFRGSNDERATAGSGVALNDGQWHTVRCDRTATRVTMTVDGVVTGIKNGSTGNISNSKPLTIAGKPNCDQITISCDYFVGDIDYVRIEKG